MNQIIDSNPLNPLLEEWAGPFGVPPFANVKPAHFRPAFDRAFAAQRAEIAAITANPEPATFDNTIAALERSGRALTRVSSVFFNLAGADTSEAIEAIERDVAPLLARHSAEIHLDAASFRASIPSISGPRRSGSTRNRRGSSNATIFRSAAQGPGFRAMSKPA
jgi:Zn-dependent oligopeptidase